MKLLRFYLMRLFTDVIQAIIHKDSLKRLWGIRLYSNAFYLMITNIMGGLLGFVFWIIVARFYSPEDVGLASALIAAVSLLAGFTHLGMDKALVRFLLRSGEDANSLINTVLTVVMLASILGIVIFIIGLNLWSPALLFIRQNFFYLAAFVIFTVGFNVAHLLDQIFNAERRAGFIAAKSTIFGLLKLFLAILLAAYFQSFGIFGSWGISLLVALLVSILIFFPRVRSGYRPFLAVRKKVLKEIMGFSLVNYIADFFWGASALVLPLMVLNLLGAEQTAYFYITWSVGSVSMVISGAVATSLFAEGSYDEERLGLNIWRGVKLIAITLVPIVVLILAIAPQLLILFGGSYSESGTGLLRIMAISALPWSISVIYLSKLRVEKQLKLLITFTMFTVVLVLGLAYFLIPRIGINGVGFAWLATHGIIALVVIATSFRGRRIINSTKTFIFGNKRG